MKQLLYSAAGIAALAAFSGTAGFAQQVISAHSGLVHYVEGQVLLDGKPIHVKPGNFPEVKEQMELRTEDGRAEVLLNPGVFLRLAENSSIRMKVNKLSDSQVEFLSGGAVIEASGQLMQKENAVSVIYKDATTRLRKSGIYRFDSDPAQIKVFSGEAEVVTGSNPVTLKSGKMLSLDGSLAVQKFNTKDGDSLTNWSERRGEYVAMANVSAAKYVSDYGTSGGSYLGSYMTGMNGWFYNPYFGMYTYLPMNGMFYSPYGFAYYSPGQVYRVYQQPRTYTVNRGGFTGGSPAYGASAPGAVAAASPARVSQPGVSAPAVRSTGSAGFGGSGASMGGRSAGGGSRAK